MIFLEHGDERAAPVYGGGALSMATLVLLDVLICIIAEVFRISVTYVPGQYSIAPSRFPLSRE